MHEFFYELEDKVISAFLLAWGEVLLKCVDLVGLTPALASGVVLVDSARSVLDPNQLD